MGLSPENIKKFKKARINGRLNNEEYLEEDFQDLNEVWSLIHKPLYNLLEHTKIEGNPVQQTSFGNYTQSNEPTEQVQNYLDNWEENKNHAEVFLYFEDRDENIYEFEAVPRNDKQLLSTEKPFSFVQLKHDPSKNRTTASTPQDEVQRLALRNAFKYNQQYLQKTPLNSGNYIPEQDLITAFAREDGIWDQLQQSEIPFSPLIRTDFKFIPTQQTPDFPGITESAPYIAEFVTSEIQDAGISNEESREAGKHIGTANALGLSFRQERETEELKLDYDPQFGESLILIDPEFAKYETSKNKINDDYSLFKQQILPSDNWRHIDQEIGRAREEILQRAKDSSKDWREVLPQQLPENWRNQIPDERFVRSEL